MKKSVGNCVKLFFLTLTPARTSRYAKVDPLDVLIRVSATNRGPEAAPLHLLPMLWFRNTWVWGYNDRRPALSAVEAEAPDVRLVHARHHKPGESTTGALGGNSNWRGPIWFPINFLLVEALQKYQRFYGDDLTVECPTGSGTKLTLGQVAKELARRLTTIFLRDGQGRRAVFGDNATFQHDAYWRDYIPFHEYFHGESERGGGASHQTGWTAVVANLLQAFLSSPT